MFVPVPAEALRATLADPARVVRCVPGLQQDADAEAGPLTGRLKVRVGGNTITYRGALRVIERDGAITYEGEAPRPGARLGRAVPHRRPHPAGRGHEPQLHRRPHGGRPARRGDGRGALRDGRQAPRQVRGGGGRARGGAARGRHGHRCRHCHCHWHRHRYRYRPASGTSADSDDGIDADADADADSGPDADSDSDDDGVDDGVEEPPGRASASGGPVPPASLDPFLGEDFGEGLGTDRATDRVTDWARSWGGARRHPDRVPRPQPAAEAAHARRTMIGRSAEESTTPAARPVRPVPAPETSSAGATLRWIAPAAALALASAVVVGRALRRRR
ncbi:carbon monoxide dehydrogenase [Streptomyces diastatochromogenes]|nr:carbon monoxide dehydrogenase [Streptomyces diastatochromogenes]